ETTHLLRHLNATDVERPLVSYPLLFEAQVARTPAAIAGTFEDAQLTDEELNARANQLAHHLQDLGIWPNTLIGLCMDRSLEMLVSLIGILKAGCAYVPLDPPYPQDRISYMLIDSQAPVLVTQPHLLALLPTSGLQVIFPHTTELEGENIADLAQKPDPEQFAY